MKKDSMSNYKKSIPDRQFQHLLQAPPMPSISALQFLPARQEWLGSLGMLMPCQLASMPALGGRGGGVIDMHLLNYTSRSAKHFRVKKYYCSKYFSNAADLAHKSK